MAEDYLDANRTSRDLDGLGNDNSEYDDSGHDEAPEDGKKRMNDSGIYQNFVVSTQAYSWLLATLRKEAIITRAKPDLMADIRKDIFACLPPHRRISRRVVSPEYKATFDLEWDPLTFLKEQHYAESPSEAIEKAITLTGSPGDAQAMTTCEYLSQVWPATGKVVMSLVKSVCSTVNSDHNITSELFPSSLDAL